MHGGRRYENEHCSSSISTISTKASRISMIYDAGSPRARIDAHHSRLELRATGARRRLAHLRYQACWARQCGQATVVETGARKLKPHSHTYAASSSGPPALRTRSTAGSPMRRPRGATGIGAGGVPRGCSARVRLRSRRVWGRLARMALCEKTLPTVKGFALHRRFPRRRAAGAGLGRLMGWRHGAQMGLEY
jgi:hypothetical protein